MAKTYNDENVKQAKNVFSIQGKARCLIEQVIDDQQMDINVGLKGVFKRLANCTPCSWMLCPLSVQQTKNTNYCKGTNKSGASLRTAGNIKAKGCSSSKDKCTQGHDCKYKVL